VRDEPADCPTVDRPVQGRGEHVHRLVHRQTVDLDACCRRVLPQRRHGIGEGVISDAHGQQDERDPGRRELVNERCRAVVEELGIVNQECEWLRRTRLDQPH